MEDMNRGMRILETSVHEEKEEKLVWKAKHDTTWEFLKQALPFQKK